MKLGVLLIHGIGIQGPDWADCVIRALRDAFSQALRHEQGMDSIPSIDDALAIEPAYWEDILRGREESLRQLLESRDAFNAKSTASGFMRRLMFWLRRQEHRFIADYLGDIIGYLHPETRQVIQGELSAALSRLIEKIPSRTETVPVTVIAHSLGSVIASEYIWDTARQRQARKEKGPGKSWVLENFFTLGSPLALFSLKFGGPEEFKKPIHVETALGRWINIYDPDDPIGMSLRGLNEAYAKAVHADVAVDAGAYLIAHASYFTRSSAMRIIGRKLALDWLKANGWLSDQAAASRYAEYDAWVKAVDE